ncbi:hypothetical protein OAI33_01360 [Pirellulaceae bacterium]|nr:hypothetical protein [Pirellulaceae bacterium]
MNKSVSPVLQGETLFLFRIEEAIGLRLAGQIEVSAFATLEF